MKELSRTQQQTRQNLLEAFLRLYKEQPIEQISIAKITQAAGYSRSTFYLYFADIYALSDAAREDVLAEILGKILALLEDNTNRTMAELLKELGAVAYEYADRILLFANEPAFREAYMQLLVPILAERSELDPTSKEYRFVIFLIVSNMLNNIEFWHRNQEDYSLEEVIAMAQTILLPGMQRFARIK